MGKKNACRTLLGKPERKRPLEDLKVGGGIILQAAPGKDKILQKIT
jgi:hypothetical protein